MVLFFDTENSDTEEDDEDLNIVNCNELMNNNKFKKFSIKQIP